MNSIESHIPTSCKLGQFITIQKGVEIGEDVRICNYSNLYGCKIGDGCMIGSHTEIQNEVVIGDNCRIQSHTFICSLVEIKDNVFVGHSVVFINDTFSNGEVNYEKSKWKKTSVEKNVIIGSNATIFPVTIGHHAVIGAGAVVLHDILPYTVVVGNPAKTLNKKHT